MLKQRGNLGFKLQVGARGPTPDPVYHLSHREETWQGKEELLSAFLDTVPIGSANPGQPALKLLEFDPRHLEAGMVDVWLHYVGAAGNGGVLTGKPQSLPKTVTIQAKLRRSFRGVIAVTDLTSSGGGISVQYADIVQETEAEVTYSYRTPSITYRYCWNAAVKTPGYQARAAVDLAGVVPTISNLQTRQTGQTWTTVSGPDAGQDLSDYEYQTGTHTYRVQNFSQTVVGVNTSSPQLRATDLVSNPVGRSGWHEVDETWEYELV